MSIFLPIFSILVFIVKIFLIFVIPGFLVIIIKALPIIVVCLFSVAFFTVMERKVLAAMQRRRGPNFVGIYGLLQAFADGFKLLSKEIIIPWASSSIIFIISPLVVFTLSLSLWATMPFDSNITFFDSNIICILLPAISSLNVYSIIFAGWSSNSKYALLGSLRAAAQLISYEIYFAFLLLPLFISSDSFNMFEIVNLQSNWCWNAFFFFPLFVLFFISILAETNRTPFDLPEAESELVSGFNTEYSSVIFVLFFLAEYSNILLMSFFTVCLFLGGWTNFLFINFFGFSIIIPPYFFFFFKCFFFLFLFLWLRATLPRFRYDQLMSFGWKLMFPLTLFYIFYIVILSYILEPSFGLFF